MTCVQKDTRETKEKSGENSEKIKLSFEAIDLINARQTILDLELNEQRETIERQATQIAALSQSIQEMKDAKIKEQTAEKEAAALKAIKERRLKLAIKKAEMEPEKSPFLFTVFKYGLGGIALAGLSAVVIKNLPERT